MSQRRKAKLEKRARKQAKRRQRPVAAPPTGLESGFGGAQIEPEDVADHATLTFAFLRKFRERGFGGREMWRTLGLITLGWADGLAPEELLSGREELTDAELVEALDWTGVTLGVVALAAVNEADPPRRADALWALEQAGTTITDLGLLAVSGEPSAEVKLLMFTRLGAVVAPLWGVEEEWIEEAHEAAHRALRLTGEVW
jgi:hypothetical protein